LREGGEWRDSRRGYDSPYRNLLVMQMVQMITKISLLLMQAGVSYNQHRLHQASYSANCWRRIRISLRGYVNKISVRKITSQLFPIRCSNVPCQQRDQQSCTENFRVVSACE
jgi:hypothetical protein